MIKSVAALIAGLLATTAHAQNMRIDVFLNKAEALEKKGPLAFFSSDLGKLKQEIMASGKFVDDEGKAARAAGRLPAACMPKGGKSVTNSDELLAYFRSLPPARRGISVKTGFLELMKQKFPCRS